MYVANIYRPIFTIFVIHSNLWHKITYKYLYKITYVYRQSKHYSL